jgi:hypothetical protein
VRNALRLRFLFEFFAADRGDVRVLFTAAGDVKLFAEE